jgi:hypothetical protein
MKRLIALAGLAACAAVVLAEPPKKGAEAKTAGKEECCTAPANRASAATNAKFDKLKKLAGVWQSGDEDKDGNPDGAAIFRVVSGGTTVAEFLMPGTEHEMVTMYTVDGDSILATHYCSLGNQPRMRSKAAGAANVLAFDFVDGANMASTDDMHIHSLTYTFSDDDHITADWKAYDKNKPSEHSPAFKLSRVKDAEAAAKISSAAGVSGCCGAAATCETTKTAAKEKN